jgi:hypothetical protein
MCRPLNVPESIKSADSMLCARNMANSLSIQLDPPGARRERLFERSKREVGADRNADSRRYRELVERLEFVLASPISTDAVGAREAFRALIRHVVVTPRGAQANGTTGPKQK